MTEDFAHAGTLIHGTLRSQDLIPALLGKLRELAPDEAERIERNWPLAREVAPDSDWTMPAEGDLIAELFDALDECAPDGWRFGSIEGDGSDFGFWRTEEDA